MARPGSGFAFSVHDSFGSTLTDQLFCREQATTQLLSRAPAFFLVIGLTTWPRPALVGILMQDFIWCPVSEDELGRTRSIDSGTGIVPSSLSSCRAFGARVSVPSRPPPLTEVRTSREEHDDDASHLRQHRARASLCPPRNHQPCQPRRLLRGLFQSAWLEAD
jgi:hypothetical protein